MKKESEKEKFKMPNWMECSWRRVPCCKDDCPICGRIKKDRQRHIDKGEDPDSWESVFEDVSRNFKETMTMIKKDCKRMGIDLTNIKEEEIREPPEPEKFSLYNKVNDWRKSIFDLGEMEDGIWQETEAAVDLFWYSNTLAAKTYRQLSTKWEMNNGLDYGDFDCEYTGFVIKECLTILKKALKKLVQFDSNQKLNLILIHDKLLELEGEILKI